MRTIDKRRCDMFVRVSAFGAAHPDLFPASTLGGRIFAALDSAVHELSAYLVTQAARQGDARGGVMLKDDARRALRDALDAIARTARALALDVPDLEGKFRLRGGRSDHDLATVTRMFLADAAPLSRAFLSHGLPATFLVDLRAKLVAFEGAAREYVAAREAQIVANVGIGKAMRSALGALQRLDAIVPNRLRDDAILQAAWASARRVRRSRAAVEPPTPQTPGPTPTTPALHGS
jgi:hypothetical protein